MAVTANDEPTEIEADVDKRFSSIIVNLPVQQTGTGTPSPSNPRPFTMWTDVSLYVSDTEEADEPTLAIELPTPMYGGKIDMVRGEIATTYNSKESGTDWEMTEEGQFRCQVSAYNNGDETSTDVADLYAVHYETVSNKDAYDATDDLTCGLATIAGTTYLYVNDAQYTTLESFATHIADEVFVFRAHIPMSDVTEPHIVYLPEGTSYVWADAGFVDYTVSGTPPLSLPNSLGKPLKAWEVDVLPYQEGSGDPSPDNVRPIHGTDTIGVYVGSPNIWDEEWERGGYSVANGQPAARADAVRCKNPIQVIPDTVYYIYGGSRASSSVVVLWYDADDNYINYSTNVVNRSRTSPSNAKYMRFYVAPETTINKDFAINYPSTVTTYNPHQGGITSITLPQTVYTGTIGSEGGESRWGEVDLGTLTWTEHTTLPNVYTGDGSAIPKWKMIFGTDIATALCSEYKLTTSAPGGVDAIDFSIALGSNMSTNIYVHNSAVADINEFITEISGVQLAYELRTPVQFPLTAPTIPTPTGTATTWATAEDGTVESMEVTYVGKA